MYWVPLCISHKQAEKKWLSTTQAIIRTLLFWWIATIVYLLKDDKNVTNEYEKKLNELQEIVNNQLSKKKKKK